MSALPLPSRRTAVVVAMACTGVVALLGLAVTLDWAPLLRLDAAIARPVHGAAVRSPWAVEASRFLETIGRFRVSFWVAAAVVLVLLVLRRWRLAVGLALLAALAPLVTDWIKVVVGRARPVWVDPLGAEPTYSFPSGHATGGLAVYAGCGIALALVLRDRRWAWVLALASTALGLAIGVSRVVLGVHWPSDVVGGWCVAVAVAAALVALLALPPPRPRDLPDLGG